MGLYIKGELPAEDRATAAVIGARNCTAYGRETADYMGRELAAAGVQVISGMALGIDGAGHEGALAGGGKTYAVLGCGVDQCYPRSNYELYESIPFHGGLISEYSLKTPPVPRNFPVRNRNHQWIVRCYSGDRSKRKKWIPYYCPGRFRAGKGDLCTSGTDHRRFKYRL